MNGDVIKSSESQFVQIVYVVYKWRDPSIEKSPREKEEKRKPPTNLCSENVEQVWVMNIHPWKVRLSKGEKNLHKETAMKKCISMNIGG